MNTELKYMYSMVMTIDREAFALLNFASEEKKKRFLNQSSELPRMEISSCLSNQCPNLFFCSPFFYFNLSFRLFYNISFIISSYFVPERFAIGVGLLDGEGKSKAAQNESI